GSRGSFVARVWREIIAHQVFHPRLERVALDGADEIVARAAILGVDVRNGLGLGRRLLLQRAHHSGIRQAAHLVGDGHAENHRGDAAGLLDRIPARALALALRGVAAGAGIAGFALRAVLVLRTRGLLPRRRTAGALPRFL